MVTWWPYRTPGDVQSQYSARVPGGRGPGQVACLLAVQRDGIMYCTSLLSYNVTKHCKHIHRHPAPPGHGMRAKISTLVQSALDRDI